MVYVPKVNKLELGAVAIKALRPTTVFSTGGAFSSTCPFLRLWILCVLLCQRTFVAGDGLGQKSKAAIADAFLVKFGWGAALDFSHCFDTIDVDVLKTRPY